MCCKLTKNKKMYFQDIIFELQNYWNRQGCIILQPLDTEVGAATFHSATALQSLNNEIWNAAYAQPCRRPSDGRYGKNPNRIQHYYQFQTLMKPSPRDIQKKCLDSLRILGINSQFHDIRFVHSDWNNPTLGAKGLGWEVWCNGMEIIQFTYMQQIGGVCYKLIPGEITYGLERLAMYIQNINNIWDITWNSKGVTYKEIFLLQEKEFCEFNFNAADTNIITTHFKDYEKMSLQLLKKNLIYPVYNYCVKLSHLFNIIESRGILSVTEKASYVSRIRNLMKICCFKFKK